MISVGQRQSVSNSSFKCSLHPEHQAHISRCMVTIRELSRAGGKAVVGTDLPTPYSTESTSSQSLAAALSTLAMSQARSTLLTILHEASIPQHHSSSRYSPSQLSLHLSSQTSSQTYHPVNSMLANTTPHPTHTQDLCKTTLNPQSAGPLVTNPNSGMRSSSMKQKTSDNHGGRDNTLPLTPVLSSPALTPCPSSLHPHCLGQERLHLWRPIQARSTQDGEGLTVNITDTDLNIY
jgi:hypothetical protein